ncbi:MULTISPECIES: hypothetical protein [Idiomarina]|uniref:Uncharacterized conserved secreted or membrane protein n=1 Tax=Idiomarina baltica OS145 TaxID=314276 RepID=A0ABM9WQ66_9GAMM|nr:MULTISPECIES: hypothetical protein [Idiomarina]EAQ33144.1 Uncharacterized conserved secreted or membrane protein [Idiomarina baltica OS145]MBL74308.1 hypothetical protein [Idiomarinaceae bacterium]MBR38195.1 hypothetical protein [Idiomarina sp.]HAE90466.1 hypothetical protein [Idiomarina sp.]|tara:strand:- start:703 stop:1245 length:543 start_codon:yes stop_codon:yes gene_type:complete
MSSLTRSQRTLLIVIAVFALPVIGAWLTLKTHWYQPATNKGVLLEQPLTLSQLEVLPEGWRVAYRMPDECSQQCKNTLYVLGQLDVALGKDSDRVTPVVLSPHTVSKQRELPHWQDIVAIQSPEIINAVKVIPSDHVFIIDPQGHVMLHYPTYADHETMVLEGKNILADLRKMLKLSRIG